MYGYDHHIGYANASLCFLCVCVCVCVRVCARYPNGRVHQRVHR